MTRPRATGRSGSAGRCPFPASRARPRKDSLATTTSARLICESHDDKGNVVEYEYLPEDTRDVDFTRASERNRSRSANRYLKFVRYGNHAPYLPTLGSGPWPAPPDDAWYFEMVFDYGE